MSGFKKTSRWLLVILVVAILSILLWRLAPQDRFSLSLGVAIVLALVWGALVFLWPARDKALPPPTLKPVAQHDELAVDPGLGAEDYRNAEERVALRESKPRLPAVEVVARYLEMAAQAKAAEQSPFAPPAAQTSSPVSEPGQPGGSSAPQNADQQAQALPVEVTSRETGEDAPPVALIVDESALADEDKIQLENAVWYRCENPYCKYTHFLEVHHIIDEKDGGNNKLDNLIVFCPSCHELAHKGEIPEKEMRDWIAQRGEDFGAQLAWHY
jgi:hypothetical protein